MLPSPMPTKWRAHPRSPAPTSRTRDLPEVDLRRVHHLPGQQFLDDRRGGVAHAGVLHVDLRARVRLDRVARIELGEAIGTDDLPVGATGQDLAPEAWPLEGAAEDRHDAAAPARHLSQFHRRADLRVEFKGEREARSCGRRRRLRLDDDRAHQGYEREQCESHGGTAYEARARCARARGLQGWAREVHGGDGRRRRKT